MISTEGRTVAGDVVTLTPQQHRIVMMLAGDIVPTGELVTFFTAGDGAGKSTALATAAWHEQRRAAEWTPPPPPNPTPDDAAAEAAFNQVWTAAVDATTSPDFAGDDDARERYRRSVYAAARQALHGPAPAPDPADTIDATPLLVLIRTYARRYATHAGWMDRPDNDADWLRRKQASAETIGKIETRLEAMLTCTPVGVAFLIGNTPPCVDMLPGRTTQLHEPMCGRGCGIPVWRHQ
jgi:hypothetical protein